MNACPDCDKPLPQTATTCDGCGWTLPVAMPSVQSRDELIERSIAEQTAKAKDYCASIGLLRGDDESYEAWVERVRKHLRATVYGRLVA